MPATFLCPWFHQASPDRPSCWPCRWRGPRGRRFSLVHVVQPPVILGGLAAHAVEMPVSINELVESASGHLDELATALLPPDLRARALVTAGNPAHEINAAAKSLGANLIVLSTPGFTGLTRVFLGSTAERVVRHAHCPVLTLRRKPGAPPIRKGAGKPPAVYAERPPWRRILEPLDFSPTSLGALRTAVSLAKQSGARLFLLNVVEPSPKAIGLEGAVLVRPEAGIMQNARKELPRIARRHVPESVPVTSLVGQGRAAKVIVETAVERKVDLIVLSTHGQTGLEWLLMGSTAEQVVRHTSCPVYVDRKSRH